MTMNKTLATIIASGLMLVGCSENSQKAPRPEDFNIGKYHGVLTSDGSTWIAKDLEPEAGYEEVTRIDITINAEVYPKYMTPEYAKKINKTIDGKMIRTLTPQINESIIQQREGIKNLSYAMAIQSYIESEDNKIKGATQ